MLPADDAVRALREAYPGVPIIPAQISGATDSMFFRALGVPSYGASASFIKDSDEFAHGLNERIAISNIRPGIVYYTAIVTDLTK